MTGSYKNRIRSFATINYLHSVILVCFLLIPLNSFAATYTLTKHGTNADRRIIDAAFPYTTPGHCAHCHEQHASIDGSEPFPPSAEGATDYELFRSNFGLNKNELCFACHEAFSLAGMPLGYGRYGIYQGKTKYNASIHYSSANMVWSPDPSPPGPPFAVASAFTDAGNCHNCHNPHGYDDGSGLVPMMLFARDSMTGDSPAYEMGCEGCHDGSQGGGTKDVKSQLNKTYAHPAHDYNDRHTLPETGESQGGNSFGNPPTYDKRHAECVDCHNPHALGATGNVHTAPGNAVSDVLKNVWGVEPSWPSLWTQPTSFTVRKPPTYSDGAQYEYQICFKCHSYYGLGTLANGVSTIIGPSGTNITDQAWEFNRNNKSAHPVVVSLNSQTGSYAPKALIIQQLKSPWDSPGNYTMYCSDCHGADNEGAGAKGPHGSAAKYMLKGTGKYWPTQSDGTTLWTWSNSEVTSGNGDPDLFCNNCHDIHGSQARAPHANSQTMKDAPCIWCHLAIPHGSKRSRLIGYQGDPAPYNYGGSSFVIIGHKKSSNYQKQDCYITNAACDQHNNNVGGYDP